MTFPNLPLGTTTLTCTATDAAGNRSAACRFTVTVRQPRAASKDLITRVKALVPGTLTTAQANGLIGHLEMANTNLERGQTAQACTHLQNFSNAVNALTTPNGPLASAQAQSLRDYANKLRTASGCPNQARAETVVLFNGASGAFHLKQQLTAEQADWVAQCSQPGDVPLAGDWDGDGQDSLGVYHAATGTFQLRTGLADGAAEIVMQWGGAAYLPVVGDWDGDGVTTIGLYGPGGQVLLRNTNTAGPPEISLTFDLTGGLPVVGKWAGQP